MPPTKSLVLEAHQDAQGVRVSLRPFPIWSRLWIPLAFIGLMVAAMTVGLDWLPAAAGRLAFPILAGLALFSTYAAALALAWHTIGREVLTVRGDQLTLEHFTWRRVSRLGFDASALASLRALPAGPVVRRGRTVQGLPCLAFDAQGKTVRFAAGLEGAEAERILALLAVPTERSREATT